MQVQSVIVQSVSSSDPAGELVEPGHGEHAALPTVSLQHLKPAQGGVRMLPNRDSMRPHLQTARILFAGKELEDGRTVYSYYDTKGWSRISTLPSYC